MVTALLATLERDGVVESVHAGHLVLAGLDGAVLGAMGDPLWPTYVRSAIKPLQALAVLDLLESVGESLEGPALAIACASHTGTDDHQIEAAHVLAMAGIDESALGCPPALPADLATLIAQGTPARLAHNCSGKHAAFLYAHAATGSGTLDNYLDPEARLGRAVYGRLADVTGCAPAGPGVDGCGAPAWRLPLAALATGFAQLAGSDEQPIARVRGVMQAYPRLIGGEGLHDSELMLESSGIVAKRGAEAVFAAGAIHQLLGPIGIAVKVADGADRAAGVIVATVLAALGFKVADTLQALPVLGGGVRHGALTAVPAVNELGRFVLGS